MSLAVEKSASGREFKVKDMSLADFGRLEIGLAETEMHGLMACRAELKSSQPLKGARITVIFDVTTESAVFIETLTALGAEVRLCPSVSTEDHAAAVIARDSAAVFAWSNPNQEERRWCTGRALDWGSGGGPDLIVDHNGATAMLISLGVLAEQRFEKSQKKVKPKGKYRPHIEDAMTIIRDGLEADPKRYIKMTERLVGVSNDYRMGMYLDWIGKHKTLLCPVFNLTESVTMKLFSCLYGSRHSLVDELLRANDVMISGKVGVVCGYGDVGKGCAAALKQAGARVVVTEINPISAIQAIMEGFQVLSLDEVLSDADIFVAATGYKDTIMVDHVKKMKNNAIVCVMGLNTQIDMSGLQRFYDMKWISNTNKFIRFFFPDTESGILVLASGLPMNANSSIGLAKLPALVMSFIFTNHTIALLELWNERATGKYEKKVYQLPKDLDERVAELHLAKFGAKLTKR